MSDIKTTYHFDAQENRDIIQRVQDCDPIIQEVTDMKQVTDGRGKTSMGYYAGRIPAIIVEQYMKEMGVSFHDMINDTTHVHRILNNPDFKRFRVFEGKIGNGGH